MVLLGLAALRFIVLVLTVKIAVTVPQLWNATAGFAAELSIGTRSRLAIDVLVRFVTTVILVVTHPD